MTFQEFRDLAAEIFEDIPDDFKAGIDGLDALRKTVLHPTLPEVYTLGECLSESYPSDFGGAGEVRSRVVLYYGSFLELSRTRDDWDWEDEVYETVTHEIRHHLEHLASEDALEEMDYAEDQNFARREGKAFDPFFYRSGNTLGVAIFEVDGDVFLERMVGPRERRSLGSVEVDWKGETLQLRIPADLADINFLRLDGPGVEQDAESFVVLVRRRGLLESVRGLIGGGPPTVMEAEAEMLGRR